MKQKLKIYQIKVSSFITQLPAVEKNELKAGIQRIGLKTLMETDPICG